MSLPDRELTAFSSILDEVGALAISGRAGDGYVELLKGRHRARISLQKGEPWATELVDFYEEAMAQYAARFGIARE